MHRPPDPRYRPPPDEPTWGSILIVFAMIAAVPMLLWIASTPLAGVLLAAFAGLLVGARRVVGLTRCAPTCRQLTVDLGSTVQITVTTRWDCAPA